MPFKSDAQRKWMYVNDPKMAKKWSAHTPKGKKLPKKIGELYDLSEGPQDLDWSEDPLMAYDTGHIEAKTPAGRYEIVLNGRNDQYVAFHPVPGTTEKYFDKNISSVEQGKKIALDHWKDLQHRRKYDEPLPMPAGPQSAARRGGTMHGRYNRFGKSGMNPLDLNSKEIEEMPHIEADIDLKGKHVSIVDLRIERYPIPKNERDRLMRAFSKSGVVGELEGDLIYFKPDYTVELIDDKAAQRLPRLPRDWEKQMQVTSESTERLPTMQELFARNELTRSD